MKTKTLSLMVLAAMASHTSAGLYSIEVLPQLAGDRATTMFSINDQGVVAGESIFGNITSGGKRVVTYRRDQGLNVVVDNLRQDGLSNGVMINNAGQIAYTHNFRLGVSNDLVRTYRYTPGLGSEELAAPNPLLSYVPVHMNSQGDIVGQSITGDGWIQNSVIWRTDGPVEVQNSAFESISITDDRTLVGKTPIGGFIRREGQNPVLLTYPTQTGWAVQMNSRGQVLGGYVAANGTFPTWLWDPDLVHHTEIPIAGGLLQNDGSITGGVNPLAGRSESLGRWTPEGGFEEITQMLDSEAVAYGFDRWSVRDVNQRGEILARAWIDDPNVGNEPKFDIILRPSPVPEPGTMLVLGAGLAALLRRRRAR